MNDSKVWKDRFSAQGDNLHTKYGYQTGKVPNGSLKNKLQNLLDGMLLKLNKIGESCLNQFTAEPTSS